ncbi:MAG: carboxylating nicotinate-nucleotide diphosphorylase [Gemmatimonadota bacterium]|nr:carboxylating nicotinate-nucleotide diphosphorylase [Gemmatimonadota bacterium]
MTVDDPVLSEHTRQIIRLALEEDIGSGDYSTLWSVPEDHTSRARVISRAGGVIAGLQVVHCLLEQAGPALRLESAVEDGKSVSAGQVVAEFIGATRTILKLERTMLNFLQRLSGVATMTSRFVEQVEGTGVKILDTRKTTPGLRELEKYAVTVGGGLNHRRGLYDYVLLKENHIAAAGGIERAVSAVRSANDLGLPVEVEVSTMDEVRQALDAGVSRIMLDNMTIEQMKIAVGMIRGCKVDRGGAVSLSENKDRGKIPEIEAGRESKRKIPEIEASGDVSLRSVAEIAGTGVDFISVGALTHSAGILNLTMLIEPMD